MEDIERCAEDVLAQVPEWLWDGDRLPIPVEDIADTCLGLYVRDVEDLNTVSGAPRLDRGQSVSGLLFASRGEIWVNAAEAREWPPRRRFTIGHELGHWVLHRTGQQTRFCRHGAVDPDEDHATTRPPLPASEEQANVFAAALLMPAGLIRDHYRELAGDFDRLCELFNCSGAAMGRRLHAVI